MYSPQEPVSPSPSTPSSGSPPPEEAPIAAFNAPGGSSQRETGTPKRRLQAGSAANRDLKSRRRDDGSGPMRTLMGDSGPREGSRREELLDVELMEKLKEEFGDPLAEEIPTQNIN